MEVMEQVAIKPWGNSQGIRLSKKTLEQANIDPEDHLSVEVKQYTIILHKLFRHKSFEERLSEYNGQINVYHYDWGEPQGKELV